MGTADIIQLGLLMVTAFGVIISIFFNSYQNKSLNKQLKLIFFADYTKRYQEIIVNLPEDINSEEFSFTKLSDKKKDKTLRLLRVYFDLCSEEYYLNKNSHIESYVWEEWCNGIQNTMKKAAFCKAWKLILKDTYYSDEFKKFMSCSGNLTGANNV